MSSLNGVMRYDGKEFLYFNTKSPLNQRLTSSQIYDLRINEDNNIVVYNFNYKIDIINPKTLTIKRAIQAFRKIEHDRFSFNFPKKIKSLLSDANTWWFVKDSTHYHLYDKQNKNLTSLFEKKESNPSSLVAFINDNNNTLWLLQKNGLLAQNKNMEDRFYAFPKAFNLSLENSNMRPMIEFSEERIIFSARNRLYNFNRKTEAFNEITLPRIKTNTMKNLSSFVKDQAGRLLFFYKGFILRLNLDETLDFIWKMPTEENYSLSSLLLDHYNNLWIALNGIGVYKVDLNQPRFESKRYKKNLITDVFVNYLKIKQESVPDYMQMNKLSYSLRSFYDADNLYFFNSESINKEHSTILKYQNEKLSEIKISIESKKPLIGLSRFQSNFWAVNTDAEVFVWDKNFKIIKSYNLRTSKSNLRINQPVNLISDSKYIWILTTRNGLLQIENGEIKKQFKIKNNESILVDIVSDPFEKDIIWIGTLGSGLIKWNKASFHIEKEYTIKDGLSSNSIAGIIKDKDNHFWISSFNGISSFDLKTEKFTNYHSYDGIIQSEFNRHHKILLPSGEIAFGSTKGYTLFNPIHFNTDSTQVEIALTDFTINAKKKAEIKVLNELKEIDLAYNENDLYLKFAILQFNNPNSNQLRYRFTNFDSTWINLKQQRDIRLSNLASGR